MTRIRTGETEGIAVARLDRLSRAGVADALRLIEEVHDHGASLAAVDLGIDPTTTFGEFALTIMLALGRMERRRITESWDTANRRAIERGIHFTAKAPYGYARGRDKRLEPIPELAPVVREIFERRAAKASRWSIASWLNEAHPREDGRSWTAQNVEVIIGNRVYLGEAFHGKHRNPDAHPPIVPPTLWEAANAVKGGSGRTSKRSPALLSGLIRCAGCRYAMRNTYTIYRGEERRRVYACQRKFGGGVCREPAQVMAHLVEPLVIVNVLVVIGGARWQSEGPGGDTLRAAEDAVDHAEARRDAFLADDELRERIAREAFLAEAERRQAAVDDAVAHRSEVRAAHGTTERREHVLADDWLSWGRERQADTLRMVLDSVYVRKGRGDLDARVLLAWDGRDEFEKPRRGTTDYKIRPIPWPASIGDPHFRDVPANAQAIGSPLALEAAMALGKTPSCDLSERPESIEEFEARVMAMPIGELEQLVAELAA